MTIQDSKSHPIISQSDLQKQLRQVDPGAVLVSARIIERIIQDAYDLPNLHWNIPHNQSFVCDRQLLFRHAEQIDLEVEPDQLLPERILLLVRPDAVEESNLERSRLLTKYWRRLFHARVHLHFLELKEKGNWDETTFQKRMEAVGSTQFEEIKNVLREDNWLHSNAGTAETYIEFVAVYLELQFFTLDFQQNYFPGIRDFSAINRLIAMDIDGESLFKQTKLAGALDPKTTTDGRTDENQVIYWRYVRNAQKCELKGDVVSAAIFRIRASRVASANETVKARKEANADIARLSNRLATALQTSDEFRDILSDKLVLLLEKADQGNNSIEARVLQDLQKVCQDHEQEIFTLDLVEYLLSGGKRPIKRPLPSQRLVRITQHLSNAVEKMNSVRLAETDLRELTSLLQQLQTKATNQLSARFRPVLETAFFDMGLSPQGPLQKASYEKMIMEVLDRINSYGYLTFAELRDTISRNQLKLPDLKDPEDFIQGDPLIRLDRRLTSLLDGVYRSSDFYVRWLERFTSWQFGTLAGRYLTLFFTIPFLLAWLLLFLTGFILEWGNRLSVNAPSLETIALVMMGPAHLPTPEIANEQPPTISHWWHFGVVIPTALFLMGLMQSDSFRKNVFGLFNTLGRWVYKVFWKIPVSHIPLHLFNQVVNSWPFLVAWSLLIKPLAIWLPVYLAFRHQVSLGWAVVLLFLVFIPAINSRTGRAFTESIGDSFLHFGTLIRSGLLPGLIRFIIQVFKQVVEFVEYVLFKVDEWLRFRAEDGQSSLLLRIFIGLFWYPIAFLARFYMVVLIEPGLNPIKFAISSVAAKIV
ncbi:MAG: hypothetical protein ACKO23_15670, partial [Gemmataceae bacterium]